jgi:hypothetical protein
LTLVSASVYASAVPALAAALPLIEAITLSHCTIKTDMCCGIDSFPSLSDESAVSRPKPASSLHTLDVSTCCINNLECIDAILRESAGVKTLWVGSRSVGRCSDGSINGNPLYPMLSNESLRALRVLYIENNKPMTLRCAELLTRLFISLMMGYFTQTSVKLVDIEMVAGINGVRVIADNPSYFDDFEGSNADVEDDGYCDGYYDLKEDFYGYLYFLYG